MNAAAAAAACLRMNERQKEVEEDVQLFDSECVDGFSGLSSFPPGNSNTSVTMAEVDDDESPRTTTTTTTSASSVTANGGCCSSWNSFAGPDDDYDDGHELQNGRNGVDYDITDHNPNNGIDDGIDGGSDHDRNEPGNRTSSAAAWVLKAKKEFHSRRFLRVKNLPQDATEEDIRKAIKTLDIKEVQINRVSQTAKVFPVTPECLENWSLEKEFTLRGYKISVVPSGTEGVLCVAHLPLIYTEQDFSNLVQMYGPVARCFLFRSEKTGEHKGYGFVEYFSKDVAYKAKQLLDQKCIGDCVLNCNWLDPSHVTYKSLHSKCLYVDHLPPNYRDMVEFRKIFSFRISPSYCQIALKNGNPLGFGLVEFEDSPDAEETQKQLNHWQIQEHKIRVTYCIPGYRAMVIYNKLTNGFTTNEKKPLLPDPPLSATAFSQLQMLALQNPQLFQSLHNLATSQLSNGNNEKFDKTSAPPPPQISPPQQPLGTGLLGHAPSPATSPKSCSSTCSLSLPSSPSSTASSPPLSSSSTSTPLGGQPNSNLQAALVLLLATQMQYQMGIQQPSILGNPQLLSLLQNILKQPPSQTESKDAAANFQAVLSLLQNGGTNCVQVPLNNQRRPSSELKEGLGFNSPATNVENGWRSSKQQQQHPFPTRQVGDAPLQGNSNNDHPRNDAKPHKIPLLPDPPMAKGETGLLPTPDSGQNNHAYGRAKPPCALRNNSPHMFHNSGGLLETPVSSQLQNSPPKPSLLGPKPQSFVGHPPTKIPLLGDKPGSVKSCLRQPTPNNSSQDLNDDLSNPGRLSLGSVNLTSQPLLSDTNGALQQIIPLILNQHQQMMYQELTKSSSQLPSVASLPTLHQAPQQRNLTSPPLQSAIVTGGGIPLLPNGNGLIYNPTNAAPPHSPPNVNFGSLSQVQQQLQMQGLPSAFVGLLMQMSSQGVDVVKGCNGDVRQAALAASQQQCQHPGTILKGGLQGLMNGGGGGGGSYSQLYGQLAGYLSSPPNPSRPMFMNPLPSLASLVALTNGATVAGGKPPMTGFTAPPPPPQFLMPQNPSNVNQLMADMQQRGSLLGDFWQVAVAQGDFPPLFAHPCNGKLPIVRPAVPGPVAPLNGKRKLHVLLPTPDLGPKGCYVGQVSKAPLEGGYHVGPQFKKKRI